MIKFQIYKVEFSCVEFRHFLAAKLKAILIIDLTTKLSIQNYALTYVFKGISFQTAKWE